MKSLDTNLLLRLVLDDIPEQSMAVNTLFDEETQKYVVEDIVFAEIVWILQSVRYHYPRERVAANVQLILAIPQIVCNRAMLEKAIILYVKYPKLSYVDTCLVVYSELNNNKPLLSFDKKLVTALPKTVATL
jgi:predicted nucleic-acid-binding protein